jgi:hypothetical protein
VAPSRFAWWLGLVPSGCAGVHEPCYWVADRAAGEVLALDRDLCVLERIPVRSPRQVGADPGGLWVLEGSEGSARPPRRLVRIERGTGSPSGSDFGELVDMDAPGDGTAFVLERHQTPRDGIDTLLWRIDAEQHRTLLGAFPAARTLAAQPGALLVGCASGELAMLRPDGAVLDVRRVPGPVRALARGPRAGEWWALAGDASMCLLDRRLEPLWSTRGAHVVQGFAPVEGEERVWTATEGRVLRHGPGGALEIELELPSGPWETALATRAGVLLLGQGALLEVEVRHGCARVRRSQGGFAALAGLAPAVHG